jgi:hypothetical protein
LLHHQKDFMIGILQDGYHRLSLFHLFHFYSGLFPGIKVPTDLERD